MLGWTLCRGKEGWAWVCVCGNGELEGIGLMCEAFQSRGEGLLARRRTFAEACDVDGREM